MSYSLYKVTWRIIGNGTVESKVSYHLDENEFYLFFNHEHAFHPKTIYATEKGEIIKGAAEKLWNAVKKASDAKIYGIWEQPKVVTLVPLN